MKLSQIIKDYRSRMNISQREFSRLCSLSNSYISFLENELNPKTGKPIIPTIDQYKKLADGMSISMQQLFTMLDEDAPVVLSELSDARISDFDRLLLSAYHNADSGTQASIRKLLDLSDEIMH